MPRILILTASYGSGHNEAARCLAAALAVHGATPVVLDHFHTCVHPAFDRASRFAYHALLRRAPALWGLAYDLGDRMTSDAALTFGMSRIGVAGLARLLERLEPDAVLTVHATPALAMAALRADGRGRVPHITVITDFVAHNQWIAPHIDRYCVAAEEVGHELVARGIPRGRIEITGVPIRADFGEPVDPAAARRALGLADDTPVVLAMSGAHGALGRLPDITRALLALGRPVQGVLVAGHDTRLQGELATLTAGSRLRVAGYVGDVRRLMAAADLLVTKAGGMTLAEALAAETPLLLYGSLPGQERRNERFASRAGIALVARNRRDLAPMLDRALGDADLLELLRGAMRACHRPGAARAIAALTLARVGTRP